jgi:uncharacterized membrane protein (TIGR02234 family)
LTFAAALLGLIVGGALALFASGRGWQTVTAHRARPLADDVLDVSGRTLHPAVTGLAVVALAGVVGILATRGMARRIIGAVLVVAGAIVGWDAVTALQAISPEHARTLLRDAQTGVGLDPGQAVTVAVHPIWPVLAAVGGVLIVLGGALTIACGAAWKGSFWPLRASSAGRPGRSLTRDCGPHSTGASTRRRIRRQTSRPTARAGGAAGPGSERRRTG